jgi:cyclophilin family peptidyl-prolyl cis-trans isomerase
MKTNLKGVFVGCFAFALNAAATTPVITSQPQSITINIASTANFAVTADNAASYQWMFGSHALAGATNSTLILDDVSTNQAGAYTVVVTSSTGDSTNSQPANLTLVPGTIVQMAFSGYAGGGASNVVVQLFDHDKPATVENFIHYIVSGAYSNLFWTRLVPGFVLQGGDYSTADRTNGPPPSLNSINNNFTQNVGFNPPFPFQIDNEYDVGPVIRNTFGTIAMAKSPGDPDSATSTFFFNLADNSTNLDRQNGGFTVFGRILSGTNILDYFNTFSTATILDRVDTSGTNGIFNSGQAPLTALPVNYHGVITPGDSNFFYVDFTFLAAPVLNTNPPTIAVEYPAAGASVTNADVTITGTAADDVGVARVVCGISAPGYEGGSLNSLDATGTTQWSADFGNLPPGTYTLNVVSQDGAGNLSPHSTNTFVVPQFPFSLSTNGPGTLSTKLNLADIVVGSNYVIKAVPGKGGLFVNWADGTNASINPVDSFVMPNGTQLSANFIANTLPGGISFTFPTANGNVAATNFSVSGKVASSSGSTTVTARIYSKVTDESVTGPMVATGSSTWLTPGIQLPPGAYIVQALASNAVGKTTVISEDFTVLAPFSVDIVGPGKTSIINGQYLQAGEKYSIRATPDAGALFYGWSGTSGTSIDPSISFTETNGVALTATFLTNALSKQLSFTYPAANSEVRTHNLLLMGNVSAGVNSPQVVCQLFSGDVPVSSVKVAAVNGATWSVPFGNLLQGSYTAVAVASDSAGRQTLVSESFKLNFFPNIAGTYYGVFFGATIATNNAGFFKFTVSSTGIMSGKLQFPIFTYKIVYPLDYLGEAFLEGGGFDGGPIYFDLNFDLTNGTDSVSGYVYSVGTLADFTGYRAVTQLPTNTVAGKYILNLETITNATGSGPTNDGFAALTISKSGGLTLGGTLADNTSFSEAVGVSKDGVWPVYATLYGGHGMLVGWETNVAGANGAAGSTGSLYWIKAPTRDTYFSGGLDIEASMTGTNYVAPVPGTQYEVVFGGGSVNPALTNALSVNNSGQFVPGPGAPDKLTISLSAAGVITGKIYNPADNKTLQIRGAFSSPSLGGSGFILDTDGQTDLFHITLVVP